MAGEGDSERLVVLLEARIKDFEKNMAKASGTATKSYGAMRRDSTTATGRMETDMVRSTNSVNRALAASSTKIGGFGKSLIAGFAGGLVAGGIAGIVSRLGQVANGVASIGDEARRAGVDIKSFQELQYVAEQNRISVSALTDGMKELNLRADEWIVTGGGAAAEAFTRLGYTATELNTKLQNPSALLSEIIGKVQGLDRAAQIRIFDELFGGTGGEQFVQLIGQGEEGIRRTIDEAHSLGIIMSEELVAKAAEVDRKFNMVANTVGTALKGAIVEAAAALSDFLNSLGQTPAQHFGELNDRIAGMREEMELFAQATARVAPESEADIRLIIDAVNDGTMGAEEAGAALREMASINMDLFPITTSLSGIIALLDNVSGKAREAAEAIATASSDPVGSGASWDGMQSTFFPKPATRPGSAGGTGSSRSSAISEADKQAKAVQNLITGLEFERSLIGLSAVEQEKMNALRQAGASATDEQRAQIATLVEATHAEKSAADQVAAAMEDMQDAGLDAMNSLVDAFSDGQVEASELVDIVGNLIKQLMSIPSVGNGIGGFFSSLFGGMGGGMKGTSSITGSSGGFFPGFDGGGYTGSGARSGGVDGKGGFPAILHPQETVIDHTKGRGQGGGAMAVHVTVGVSADSVGNLTPFVEKVAVEQAAMVTKATAPGIAEQGSRGAMSLIASGDADGSMRRYGVQPQTKRR